MTVHPKETKLTDPSRDDLSDGEMTLNDYLGRPEHVNGERFVRELRSAGKVINEGMKAFIEIDLGHQIDVEIAEHFARPGEDSNLVRSDEPEPDSHHATLEETVRSILAENGNPPQEQEYSTTTRIALALAALTLTGAGGTLAMYLLKRCARNQGDADITQVSADVKAKLRQLVKDQNAQPDDRFWNHLADYVDNGIFVNGSKVELTLADQLVYLNFVIAISPLSVAWDWGPSANQYRNAQEIKRPYDASKKVSDIYRHVLDAKFEGQVLPRATAAQQLQTVLAWIYGEL
jgi:hypothetical protein